MGTISTTLNLLGTGAAAFVYHLLILLALEAAAGIAWTEYRHTRNPDQNRFLWTFLCLLLLRLPLLVSSSLLESNLAPLPYSLFLLLTYALEVVGLTLMWWAFLSPLVGERNGRLFLAANLILTAIASAVLFPVWYRALSLLPLPLYQGFDLSALTFWTQTIWNLWAMLIPLSATVLLLLNRKRLGYSLPAISFAFITLGNGIILLGQLGIGRLVNLLGYPLLAVAVYRSALQDLWSYRQELETLSEESLRQTREMLFLVDISRAIAESLDLDVVLQRVAEGVAHAVDGDRAAIFLTEDENRTVRLAAQYTVLQTAAEPRTAPPLLASAQPVLNHVIQRRRQLILEPREQQLQSLYTLLGSSESGPTIIQPLMRQQRVLGVMVVGNDRSKTVFGDNEARLCGSIAAQVSAAIDNARLYHDLARTLKAQEEEVGRREAILESTTEGIIVTDAGGRAVLMNGAAEELLGAERERILGRPLRQIVDPAIAEQLNLGHVVAPLQTLFEVEGKQIHVSAAPVRTGSGEFLGQVAVLRDVTREVQAERAKREFIATISHELRTPLTAILGYAEALYGGMVGALNQTQHRFVRIVHDNARRMITMANNLIALSEAERGRLELEYAETDLHLIASEVIESFVPEMRNRQLTWKLEIGKDLPSIEADPNRIRQVIANLVSNAVRYTYPGGEITVGIAAVDDPDTHTPSFCQIWVQDTGVGIPAEEQAHIWERFYRADNPLKVEAGGLGVGLSIVRSLVRAHGGRVWMESTPNKGSTFTILIPISRPTPLSLKPERETYPDVETATNWR